LIKKLWDIAWDLWQDRNGINAEQKLARCRLELHHRIEQEFDTGYDSLYPRSRLLFTQMTLPKRLELGDQTLESWLLRVGVA